MRFPPMPPRTIRAALALPAVAFAVTLLAGCALFAPRLEPPKLSIVGVELVKGDLFEQRLRARMRVQNPNDRELAVKGVTYSIEVGGEEFGRGMSGSSFVVPAGGAAEFDMMITANLAGTLLRLASRAQQGEGRPDALEYRIAGKVSMASGVLRSIPFEDKGALKLR